MIILTYNYEKDNNEEIITKFITLLESIVKYEFFYGFAFLENQIDYLDFRQNLSK